MEEDKRASSPSAPVKLFVGCVPSEISLATLEEHFSQFGKVQRVTRLSRKKSLHQSEGAQSKGLGHCIVVVSNRTTAEKILQTAAHTIQGRKLLVEKYLQGSARLQNVESRNQKRFFLKGIPFHVGGTQLLDWLSTKHGQVEVLHEIKPRALPSSSLNSLPYSGSNESNSPQSNGRKLPTKIFSVQFKSLEEATKFSKSSQRYFKNNRIQVERYDFSRGNNISPSLENSVLQLQSREFSSQQVLPSTGILRVISTSQRDISSFNCKPTQTAYHTGRVGSTWYASQSECNSTSPQSHGYRFNLSVMRSLSG